jgi:hypothetical protein
VNGTNCVDGVRAQAERLADGRRKALLTLAEVGEVCERMHRMHRTCCVDPLGVIAAAEGSQRNYACGVHTVTVELLVVADCPHENAAATLLRTALDELGLTRTAVRTSVIETQLEAEQRGFTGSPTILIDGVDPFTEPGGLPALACRVYPTASGTSGVPDLSAVRQALKDSIDSGVNAGEPPHGR